MSIDYKPPLDLLVRYLRSECSATETSRVDAWLLENDDNYHYLQSLKKEWVFLGEAALQLDASSKHRVWESVRQRMTPVIRTIVMPRSRFFMSALAIAGIALLIGIGATFIVQKQSWMKSMDGQYSVIETSSGQKSKMTLPDGTQMWLNSGTKVSYANSFNQSNREIILEGEAFFDVVKHADLPFIVRTSDFDIRVKGTAFDVSAYADDSFVEVSLLRGAVDVYRKDGVLVKGLEPNDLLRFDKEINGYSLLKGNNAEQYSTWTAEELIFENESLDIVIKKMERWYGVDIDWVGQEEAKRYTFKIKTESLREILHLIDVITPINYAIKGSDVHVDFR